MAKSRQPNTPVGQVWTLFRAASPMDTAMMAFAAISKAVKPISPVSQGSHGNKSIPKPEVPPPMPLNGRV